MKTPPATWTRFSIAQLESWIVGSRELELGHYFMGEKIKADEHARQREQFEREIVERQERR